MTGARARHVGNERLVARFIVAVGERELVVYGDVPSSAARTLIDGMRGTIPRGLQLQPAGWYDRAKNMIVDAPDQVVVTEARTVFG